ncbi:MAG: O-antigen ligase family protein [Phycisphaerae bacterium]
MTIVQRLGCFSRLATSAEPVYSCGSPEPEPSGRPRRTLAGITDGPLNGIILADRLQTASWYLLLVVVGLRPLIGESYTTSRTSFAAALHQIADPMPAVTLVIDAVILLAALLWLTAWAWGRSGSYRPCGIEWGALLIALAGLVSCLGAGNRRVAINATVDWLCLPLMTVVLVQVIRTGWRVRLTLCVILASATAQAYECFNQVVDTLPQTQRVYELNKVQQWAAAGVELDSPQVAMFERRLYGREATGYLTHSNVTGAYLAMAALAGWVLIWNRWKSARRTADRVGALPAAMLTLAMIGAAWLTGSRGALVAGGLGLVLWLGRSWWLHWSLRRPRRVFWAGWGLVLGAGLATLGHGLYHGSLPGASLNFRWQYWTASARIFADHWLTGVGRENFAAHYLAYKQITSPEEVSNPHNLLVQAATEWGALGAVGVIVMLVGGSWVAMGQRRWSVPEDGVAGPPPKRGAAWRWAVMLAAGIFGARTFLLGSDQPAYVYYATTMPLIFWTLGFAAFAGGLDRTTIGLATGINCALFVFLLQETINFGVIVPGSAATFFALLAVPLALRAGPVTEAASGPRRGRWLCVAAGGLVLGLHAGLLCVPVARANAALQQGRSASSSIVPGPYASQPAYRAFMRAVQADPLDPTPCAEAALYLIGYAEQAGDRDAAIARALALADQAVACDPYATKWHRQKMHLARRAFQLTGDRGFLDQAVASARRIVGLYPESPSAHADMGEMLLQAGRAEDAVEPLTRALALDQARPAWEELRRFSNSRRAKIERQLKTAASGQDPPDR